jgi:DNA-binding transcriptional LysR family regulator
VGARILDNWTAMQQDIAQRATRRAPARPSVRGRDSVGAADGGAHGQGDHARYPDVELTILSHSSIDILRHLEEFTIDVGFTYLDNEPVEGMRAEPIYMERYCLLVRADHELARRRR